MSEAPKPTSQGPSSQGPSGYRPRPGGPSSGGGYRPQAGGPPRGPGGPGGFRRRPPMRRRVCRICADRNSFVDWKAPNFLRNFITDRGKIMSGRSRGTCSKCQRQLTRAIKRARTMALMPFALL